MAIDDAEKRRSAAGVPAIPLGPGVTPNASKDQEWRQQVAWGYSGILAGAGGGGTTGILRQHTDAPPRGFSGVAASHLDGVLVH